MGASRTIARALALLACFGTASPALAACGGGGTSSVAAPVVSHLRGYRAPFGAPARMAVDAAGNIYVTDPAAAEVVVRAPNGSVLARAKVATRPVSVAVGAAGRVYVGDSATGGVTAYDSSWQALLQLGQGAGEFLEPSDLAVDAASGEVYAADSKAHVVKVYDADGLFLRSFGSEGTGDGQFNYPVGVFVDAAVGEVLVADQVNSRIQVFDLGGNFVRCFGGAGSGAGKFNMPQGVTVDGAGRVYVADSVEGRVQVLDRNGDFISFLGDFGEGVAQMRVPLGMVIDPSNRLFVAASSNARLEMFGLDSFTDPETVLPAVARLENPSLDRARPGTTAVAYVEIAGYVVGGAGIDAVVANGVDAVSVAPTAGDSDGNGVADLRVEFPASALLATLPADGRAGVAISGTLAGVRFEATAPLDVTTCAADVVCPLGDADPQCNEAACDPGVGCIVRPKNEGAGCEDGNACTMDDVCTAGSCGGGAVVCNDNNTCTDDSCDAVSGCVYAPNTAPCDDASACTSGDACVDGACTGTALVCNDSNACTDDSCDAASGCVYAPNTAPCDDASACTSGDACVDGACKGTALVCDDSSPCTDDSCDAASGCVFAPHGGTCDDGNACTTDDACTGGLCTGQPLACHDTNACTDDRCDPASGCVFAANAAACNDADPCTSADTCAGGVCTGISLSCNDGNPCTDDACDGLGGCTHVARQGPCDDGDPGTIGDACDVAGACRGEVAASSFAILQWPAQGAGRRVAAVGGRSRVHGDLCAEALRVGRSAELDGDVLAWLSAGSAVALRPGAWISGNVDTGGGAVVGLDAATVDGVVDASGSASALARCVAARAGAAARRADLEARPVTDGLALGHVQSGALEDIRIPASGDVGAGRIVIDADGIDLAGGRVLTIAGSASTEEVVVHVRGWLTLQRGAAIVADGFPAERLVFVVDGAIDLGPRASVDGSLFGAGTVRVGKGSSVSGAVFGRTINLAPTAAVDLRPFVGW